MHTLEARNLKLLSALPTQTRAAWIGWGFDYYALISGHQAHNHVLPETLKMLDKGLRVRRYCAAKLRQHVWTRKWLQEPLAKIKYFCPVLDLEFEAVKTALNADFEYLPWNYGTCEDDLLCESVELKEGHVLCGNSASPENNHMEAFRAIAELGDNQRRKIIAPLSYGNSGYRKSVIAAGKKIFGSRFLPLEQYLPASSYWQIVGSCDSVVMNHTRQQGVLNICSALLAGAEVFMHPSSLASQWFSERGASILSSCDMQSRATANQEARRNREVVVTHWSRQASDKRTERLMAAILD